MAVLVGSVRGDAAVGVRNDSRADAWPGFPPAYADGFEDGCSSGRQAAGVPAGDFRKNVPRYLQERQYESGWDDGFRQCQAMQERAEQQRYHERFWDERDREWQQEKDRGAARAWR